MQKHTVSWIINQVRGVFIIFSMLRDVVCEKQQVVEKFTFGFIYGLYVDNAGLIIYSFFYCFSVKIKTAEETQRWFSWKVCQTGVLSSISI